MTDVVENILPQITEDEQLEQDIRSQSDCREIIKRDEDETVFANIVWTAVESETLGKRVTSIYKYSTLMECDGTTIIGRTMSGIEKVIGDYGVDCNVNTIQIVGSLKRGE